MIYLYYPFNDMDEIKVIENLAPALISEWKQMVADAASSSTPAPATVQTAASSSSSSRPAKAAGSAAKGAAAAPTYDPSAYLAPSGKAERPQDAARRREAGTAAWVAQHNAPSAGEPATRPPADLVDVEDDPALTMWKLENYPSCVVGRLFGGDRKFYPSLGMLKSGDELYIVGHSFTGAKLLKGATKLLGHSELLDVMERCGFPKGNNVKITMYACLSAKVPAGEDMSLATAVADEMRNRDYQSKDNVHGFMGYVSQKAGKSRVDADGGPFFFGIRYDKDAKFQDFKPNKEYALINQRPRVHAASSSSAPTGKQKSSKK